MAGENMKMAKWQWVWRKHFICDATYRYAAKQLVACNYQAMAWHQSAAWRKRQQRKRGNDVSGKRQRRSSGGMTYGKAKGGSRRVVKLWRK